jgi:riboflavin-specific deaminase-like protein
LADDPRLTVRLVKGKNPFRIIVDSKLRIPLQANVLREQNLHRTIIATTSKVEQDKITAVRSLGAEVLVVKSDERGRVDLKSLLKKLGKKGLASVMVEGGSKIITSMLKAGLVDKLVISIAPKILGKGLEAIGDLGISGLNDVIKLSTVKIREVGDDFLFENRILEKAGCS